MCTSSKGLVWWKVIHSTKMSFVLLALKAKGQKYWMPLVCSFYVLDLHRWSKSNEIVVKDWKFEIFSKLPISRIKGKSTGESGPTEFDWYSDIVVQYICSDWQRCNLLFVPITIILLLSLNEIIKNCLNACRLRWVEYSIFVSFNFS